MLVLYNQYVIAQKSDAKYRNAITIEALKRKGIIQ
jgi:hypothetical protein